MQKDKIVLNITNTQPFSTVVSLLGGFGDSYNQNTNAFTLYTWDLSGVNFGLNANFILYYRPAGSSIPYSIFRGECYYSYQLFLNTLNKWSPFGFFWYDINNRIVRTANDQIQFGQFGFDF